MNAAAYIAGRYPAFVAAHGERRRFRVGAQRHAAGGAQNRAEALDGFGEWRFPVLTLHAQRLDRQQQGRLRMLREFEQGVVGQLVRTHDPAVRSSLALFFGQLGIHGLHGSLGRQLHRLLRFCPAGCFGGDLGLHGPQRRLLLRHGGLHAPHASRKPEGHDTKADRDDTEPQQRQHQE